MRSIFLASGTSLRVGGGDAAHIGEYLADIRVEHGGQRDGRGVGAAPAERGDVGIAIDALEARDDDDLALTEGLEDPRRSRYSGCAPCVKAVGDDADLAAGEADGRHTEGLDGDGHQGDGDLLAGGEQHVQLTPRRPVAELTRRGDQVVGGVATR